MRLVRAVIDDRAIGVMREVRAASSAQGHAAGSAPTSFSVVGQNASLRGHWARNGDRFQVGEPGRIELESALLTASACLRGNLPLTWRGRSSPPGTFSGAGRAVTTATAMAAISFADKGRRRAGRGDCRKCINRRPFSTAKLGPRPAAILVVNICSSRKSSRSAAIILPQSILCD